MLSPDRLSQAPVPLESVIITDQLERRSSRPADYAAQSVALDDLMSKMAQAVGQTGADQLLQRLAETALQLCNAHSAGVSILETDSSGAEIFRWRAVAGSWARFLGESMPRHASPCGAVLASARAILMSHPERHYQYCGDAPPLAETLLVPFHSEGKPVGTVWIIAHDETRRFDAEDRRLLTSLSQFAAAAYQLLVTQELRLELATRNAVAEQRAADLERIKQAESALLDMAHRKDDFLAMLAHELRNPLAPIRNVAQILQLTSSDPEAVRRHGEILKRQVNHLARLVDDLSDVARINRGTIELRKDVVALATILDSALEMLRPVLNAKQQRVSRSGTTAPQHVHGDPVRLTQIVSILLDNACKFSPPGSTIEIGIQEEAGVAALYVRDPGAGIPAAMMPTLFEPFRQADYWLTRSSGGLGIGLALAKTLAELHGGSVKAHSAGRGCGSEFTVRLPVVAQVRPSAPGARRSDEQVAGRSILVVEDNQDGAQSLATLLRLSGNEVETVHDGSRALDKLETFPAEFVLLDIGLPGIDGYCVARSVRERFAHRLPRIYALTGFGREEDRQHAIDSGFDGHLTKPVDPNSLLELLQATTSPVSTPPMS